MRDALNATGRPIYYSICEIGEVAQTPVVLNSPSSCGRKSAYTSLEWSAHDLDVKSLANSARVFFPFFSFLVFFRRSGTQISDQDDGVGTHGIGTPSRGQTVPHTPLCRTLH